MKISLQNTRFGAQMDAKDVREFENRDKIARLTDIKVSAAGSNIMNVMTTRNKPKVTLPMANRVGTDLLCADIDFYYDKTKKYETKNVFMASFRTTLDVDGFSIALDGKNFVVLSESEQMDKIKDLDSKLPPITKNAFASGLIMLIWGYSHAMVHRSVADFILDNWLTDESIYLGYMHKSVNCGRKNTGAFFSMATKSLTERASGYLYKICNTPTAADSDIGNEFMSLIYEVPCTDTEYEDIRFSTYLRKIINLLSEQYSITNDNIVVIPLVMMMYGKVLAKDDSKVVQRDLGNINVSNMMAMFKSVIDYSNGKANIVDKLRPSSWRSVYSQIIYESMEPIVDSLATAINGEKNRRLSFVKHMNKNLKYDKKSIRNLGITSEYNNATELVSKYGGEWPSGGELLKAILSKYPNYLVDDYTIRYEFTRTKGHSEINFDHFMVLVDAKVNTKLKMLKLFQK